MFKKQCSSHRIWMTDGFHLNVVILDVCKRIENNLQGDRWICLWGRGLGTRVGSCWRKNLVFIMIGCFIRRRKAFLYCWCNSKLILKIDHSSWKGIWSGIKLSWMFSNERASPVYWEDAVPPANCTVFCSTTAYSNRKSFQGQFSIHLSFTFYSQFWPWATGCDLWTTFISQKSLLVVLISLGWTHTTNNMLP